MTKRRRIAIVTTARSDYGILRPLIAAIHAEQSLDLLLIVGGAHLSPRFGFTIDAIDFPITARVPFIPETDDKAAFAHALGKATSGFADAFAAHQPDLVVLLGDRWETLGAASAAYALGLPVAHLHGGELTLGAMDDCFRHAITKLSHLHFAATETYAARIRQLGEEDWRVVVSGAPGLDAIRAVEPLPRAQLPVPDGDFLLVTFHPVTTALAQTADYVGNLMAALEQSGMPLLFTYAGADSGASEINAAIDAFCAAHAGATVMPSLGSAAYFSAMKAATAMVGNSSSGIIEAASFRLPVVNIGTRQAGRVCGANVIHCGHGAEEISAAIAKAATLELPADFANPYDRGGAVPIIVEALKNADLQRLTVKGFVDRVEEQA